MDMTKNQNMLPRLGLVRMIVIAFIAFGYASTMPRGPSNPEYLQVFGYDPSWYGISVVFMISGFLAMRSLARHGSAARLLISRMGRNMPVLAIFALLVIFVLYPFFGAPVTDGGSRLGSSVKYFLKVVTCLDANQVTPGLLDNALYMCIIQGGLWTFRWGLIAFVLTAGLWAIGGLRDRNTLAGLTLGLVCVYAALSMYTVKTIDLSAAAYFEFAITGLRLGWIYMAGMCAFAYRDVLPRNFLLPAGLIAWAGLQSSTVLPWTPMIEITMTLGLSYLAYLVMTSTAQGTEKTARLPDISLGLYVFNWPMAQIVLLLIPSLGPLGLFAMSFPLTILLSLVIWTVISRPIGARLTLFATSAAPASLA